MRDRFRRFAIKASNAVGSPQAFMLALASILIWAALGPVFGWSEKHSLAVNTGTTISTFLMLFLLQYAQNREAKATHIKLDELLRAGLDSRNKVIGLEDREDGEMQEMQRDIHGSRDKD